MRFSAPDRPRHLERVLGDLARRLEARVRPGSSHPVTAPARALVLFRAEALSREEIARLESLGSPAPARREDGFLALEVSPGELAPLASELPAAACLLAALEHALAPSGPMRLMGVVNVTADSFSDGGAYLAPERAIAHGLALAEQGADILDVGGESTRPGAEPVEAALELERVVPVVRALARDGRAAVSIDTTKASVAAAALDAGACIVNDVSAGRNDPEMLALAAERKAGLILMHMQGTPRDMQRAPRYADVVREVLSHLRERAHAAWKAGVEPSRIALDPGLGFGKRPEHNLELMRALPELRSLGFPLCLGVSRKSFLGHLSGQSRAELRGPETCAAVALGAYLGAELHRVHDVASARAALSVGRALAAGERG